MPIRLRRDVPPLIALLLLACLPFSEAVLDPSQFPVGLDSVQHYSRESFVRRALSAGVLPGWNPYEFSGFPALADPQTGVFYPPSVVLRVLALPAFLTWTVVFHIWLFGAGAYVLCRVVGVDRWVALLAAVGLMLGGITMPRVYAGHLDVLRTVAWVPLALALAIRSIDRGTIWPSALLIVVLSLQVLGSFLQLTVYTLAAVAMYALFSAMWPPSGEPSWGRTRTLSAHLMLVVLFVLGMTAFQLVPTAGLIAAAGRTGGMEYAGAVAPAIGLDELTRFVLPSLDVTIPPESWETSSYIGLLAAVIAPAAVWATRRRRFVAFFVL